MIYVAWYFVNSLRIKNGKQLMKRTTRIIANWVLKLKIVSWQTGSRNLTGPKTLPTIWYTYTTLVTKYQISAINSYWEKCDEKYFGRTEVKRKMCIYKCMLNVYKNQQNRGAGVYKCFIFILFLENVNYNEDNHLLTSTYSYQGTLVTLTSSY